MMSQGATAQTENQTTEGSQPVVTSMDDVKCPDGASLVHCVEMQYHNQSTLSTSGTATTKIRPDKFTVTVGVETSGTTAQEAASENADLTAKVIAALKELGITDEQISTSYYSLYPIYRPVDKPCIEIYPPPPECQSQQITGYRASNSVNVTLDADGDVEAGEAIDAAIEAGANNVSGVYFFVSQERQDQVRDSLIADAIASVRHRADVAAQALGMQVSGVKSVNLNDVYFPILYRSFEASQTAGTPILPGEQEVSSTVSVTFYLGATASSTEDNTGADEAVAIARQFILSRLPSLGIEIDDELDLHTDMVVHVSESEFHVDFSVLDTSGQSHDGHIEIVNGEVTVAVLDGESIL